MSKRARAVDWYVHILIDLVTWVINFLFSDVWEIVGNVESSYIVRLRLHYIARKLE